MNSLVYFVQRKKLAGVVHSKSIDRKPSIFFYLEYPLETGRGTGGWIIIGSIKKVILLLFILSIVYFSLIVD
jgi:hypothetical protein